MQDLISRKKAEKHMTKLAVLDRESARRTWAKAINSLADMKSETDEFKNKLMMYLADLQLTYSTGWGSNGQGDRKLYEFVTGLIEEIERWDEQDGNT